MMLDYLPPALRMLKRRIRVALFGIKKFEGNHTSICKQVIKACYDKRRGYFRVSSGHFQEFYCRDFGWSCESLLLLGYRKEVVSTLKFALEAFEKHGVVEQCVSPSGKCFTFPNALSIDALAFLVRSLRLTNETSLTKKHKNFIERETKRLFNLAINKKTGLIKKDLHTSSIKDYAIRESSCYDNCMCGMLATDLAILGLYNPFSKYNYAVLIKKYFWKGSYFAEDLSKSNTICGDANTMPFWSGIISNNEMLKNVIHCVTKEGLDKPFPLKYTSSAKGNQKMIGLELLAGNYERNAIWVHIGLMYMQAIKKYYPRMYQNYYLTYKKQIEKHKNFLEVYDADGKPFSTVLYYSDEGMLWAANYLV